VHVGDGTLPLAALDLVERGIRKVALVTHPALWTRYGAALARALTAWGVEAHPIPIGPGERSKSLRVVARIYDALVDAKIDRGGAVLALGGGVVGDAAGFAAATYLRGVGLVHLPTTLLAQVDASIGGKTAVNLAAKNLVGVFWQPLAVHADVRTLRSLPARELRCGLAEAIKHAAIADAGLFDWTEARLSDLVRRDAATLVELVARNAEIKAGVVAADERELTGAREVLNFGHTVGHAVEAVRGYRGITHGEAVSVGMSVEAEIGVRLGIASAADAARLRRALSAAGLPTRMPSGSVGPVLERMSLDKKVRAGAWRLSLMGSLGTARVGVVVEPALVREVIIAMTEPTP
jgi:3-dehydroquinate synthase